MFLSEFPSSHIHSDCLFGLNLESGMVSMLIFSFLFSNNCLNIVHKDEVFWNFKRLKKEVGYTLRWFRTFLYNFLSAATVSQSPLT